MSAEALADFALRQAQEMRVRASECRQLGFKNLAAHLRRQADAAEKWANAVLTAPQPQEREE